MPTMFRSRFIEANWCLSLLTKRSRDIDSNLVTRKTNRTCRGSALPRVT
jgi:hypothetical protein